MEEIFLDKPQKPKERRKGEKHSTLLQNNKIFPIPENIQNESHARKSHMPVFMPKEFMGEDTVTNRFRHMTSLAGESFRIGDLKIRELDDLLFDLEQLSLATRQMMADRLDQTAVAETESGGSGYDPSDSSLVHVEYTDGLLSVFLPNTFLRSREKSWYLSTIIKEQLLAYESKNGIVFNHSIKEPFNFIVKRNVLGFHFSYRDNDNLETSKIINAICSVLGVSDRADRMSYTSILDRVTDSDKCGTIIYVFQNKDIEKYWKLFSVAPLF